MKSTTLQLVCTWSLLAACVGLAACQDADDPQPPVKLAGTWTLTQEYRQLVYFSPSGTQTSRYDYARAGEPGESLVIGDSTWVFQPVDIYSGTKDGVYKQTDTTVVVKLNRPSGFNFPILETYTISALDKHRVVIRQKDVWRDQTHSYKWLYTR